jgi:hypothetical protein
MPAACDGYRAKMTVEHALSCKVGDFFHIRHDDVADNWWHLCGIALSPAVKSKVNPVFLQASVTERELQASWHHNSPTTIYFNCNPPNTAHNH